jgi:hypothetical protein
MRLPCATFTLAALLAVSTAHAGDSLIPNGTFDHEDGDLTGWITDYAFSGNSHYMGNKGRVKVERGAAVFKAAGDAGVKMECIPIAFEKGYKYTAELKIKSSDMSRVYFAGYKWKPGIRPHDMPELGELRMIYKSKADTSARKTMSRMKIQLPGVKLSSAAKSHLKHVRFITLYVWMRKEGSIDDVRITRTKDPVMDF